MGWVTMSERELNRVEIISQGWKRYRHNGPSGLCHVVRERTSNYQIIGAKVCNAH